MSKKKMSSLNTYGKSLAEVAKLYHHQIKVMKESGEVLEFEKDIYLCPLCLKNCFYFLNDEFFQSEEFSIDHYPPKSAGGNQTILVCKPCNDLYGRTMDYALKEYLTSQAFLNKDENIPFPVKIAFNGVAGDYNVGTRWQKGMMVQNISFNNYPNVKEWMFDLKKEEWSFRMKMMMPSEKIIAKALLRASYLYCFANWGYDFALSYTGLRLARIIQGKEEHPLSNCGVFGDVSTTSLQNGFYFLSNPRQNQSFQVLFEIGLPNHNTRRKIFVVIPGPSNDAWDNLIHFDSWIEKKKAKTKVISIYSNCVEREYYTHYHYTWQELKNK